MKKKTLFNANWLEEDQFKYWLTSTKDGNKARCKLCKKDIESSNMGKYLINFGIAPYYKSVLLERIKESPCFVISYDESLNPVTQTCEMDLLPRYFDETEERVKIRYLDS